YGGEIRWMGDVQALQLGYAYRGKVGVPVKRGALCFKRLALERVIHLFRISPFVPRHRRLGQRRLEVEHDLGAVPSYRRRLLQKDEDARQVTQVGFSQRIGSLAWLQVIVAVRQGQIRLIQHPNHLRRVSSILVRAKLEDSGNTDRVQPADRNGQ